MSQRVSSTKFSWNLILLSVLTAALVGLNLSKIENAVNISSINPLVFVNLAVIVVALSLNLAIQNSNIPAILFWSFEYIFFGFTVFSIAVDRNPLYLNSLKESKYFDVAIILVFILHFLFFVIQLSNFGYNKQNEQPRLMRKTTINCNENCKKIFFIYYASFPFLLSQLGGVNYLFRRSRSSEILVDYSSPLFSISEAILYVTPVLLVLFTQQEKLINIQILSKQRLYILYFTLLILSNPFANARQTTILLLFPIVYRLIYKHYRLTILFTYTLLFSSFFLAKIVNRQTGVINGPIFYPPSRLGDYDAFGQLMNTLEYIDAEGISYLKQITGSIFFFIPRNIWVSKPSDSGVLIANFKGLSFQNLSCPWIAEAILNFGFLGLFAISIIFGIFFKRTHLSRDSNYMIGAFISSMEFIVLRGSLLQATGKLVFGLFLILVFSRLCLSRRIE